MREKLKLDESARLYKQASELVPGATLGALRPYNFIPKEYPVFFKSGAAGRVTDVDGNEYIDLMATFGAIVIGHRVEEIDNAVIEQIRSNGFCLTLTQPVQHMLAAKLRELIPSCEKSFMVKSGSDGTHAAIRMARAYTGRNKILRCGYHGWHDWSVEVKAGVPAAVYNDVMEFAYNDLDQVCDLMSKFGDQIAGIIVWPIGTPLGKPVEMPKPGFLKGLRSLADQYGAVLIFDELRTGFRVGLGGAQKEFGVIPDISVVGKAMANGYAIGAVVGNSKVMKVAESKIFVSSTFFHNSFPQVAALKTIEIMERDDVLGKLRIKGEVFGRKLAEVVRKSGVNCAYSGTPWMPQFTFHAASESTNMKLRFKFFTNLIRCKVFASPFHHGFFIYQHTDAELELVVASVEESSILFGANGSSSPAGASVDKMKIILIGTGEHARVSIDAIEQQGKYEIFGLVSNRNEDLGQRVQGYEVICKDDSVSQLLAENGDIGGYFLGIGVANGSMKRRFDAYQHYDRLLPAVNVISPQSVVSRFAELGRGIFLEAYTRVANGVSIGNHSLVQSFTSVNHDQVLGENVLIGCNVSLAGSSIGSHTIIADGSSIGFKKNVGKNCLVSDGAVVTKDLPDNMIAYGNPAKTLPRKETW